MTTPLSTASDAIKETKSQYLIMLLGIYFMTGFFWTFSSLGSTKLNAKDPTEPFFLSMIVLMLSNGVWEILTGWYADKFKRKFSISAGFFACFLGFVIMGVASVFPVHAAGSPNLFKEPSFLVWLTGITVWSLGPAMLSGAKEAWLVDRCNFLSANPPEPLGDVFKKAAGWGVVAKALGSLFCFFAIFWLIVDKDTVGNGSKNLALAFWLSAGPAAALCFALFVYSRRLEEEYWSDPKYQSDDSLFAFLWMGIKDLWKVPYRWFTLAFIGATGLNYALSSTVWPYLGEIRERNVMGEKLNMAHIAAFFIGIELAAGLLSRPFSKVVDKVRELRWRMPLVSLMYLFPLLPLYFLWGRMDILPFVLIAVTFLYRTAHASVFGTLNAIGQLAIDSDERRAVLISLSSALAAFMMAGAFMIVNYYDSDYALAGKRDIAVGIKDFWAYLALPGIFMLAVGGYLVARREGGLNDKQI